MTADRGRRRNTGSGARGSAAASGDGRIRLAPGVKLLRVGAAQKLPMLQCPEGRVPLNDGAVMILRLCNGSHSREEIIAEVSDRADSTTLAADVSAFLDAARTRGWIV